MSRARRCLLAVSAAVATTGCVADEVATCEEATGERVELSAEVGALAPMAAGRVVVHVPPCVDPAEADVLVLFHGGGLGPASWWDEPVRATAVMDDLTLAGDFEPTIVVLPGGSDGGHFFAEHALGPVLQTVEAFRGAPIGSLRYAGFSAGALTAGEATVVPDGPDIDRLGLFGAIWSNGLNMDLADNPGDPALMILADTGVDDGGGEIFVPAIAEAAASAGIEMTVVRHPGGHDLDFVASRIEAWLRWLIRPTSG